MVENANGVSVVMAVHNGERFLAEAVESVLNQTMPELELIAVDDGSTDTTPRILESYAARDSRVQVLRLSHGGVPRAVNAGIGAARYGLIARTDADDRMLPQRLERQLAFLAERPELSVACSYSYFISAAGKRIGSSARPVELERGKRELRPSLFVELTQSTVIMRKAAFFGVGGYREDLAYAEDRDLWGRFATDGHAIGCQPEFLVEFRQHGGSMTMRDAAVQHETCRYIDFNIVRRLQGLREYSFVEYGNWERARPLAARLKDAREFRALHAFKKAARHYGEGRYFRCASNLAIALFLEPARLLSRAMAKTRKPESSKAPESDYRECREVPVRPPESRATASPNPTPIATDLHR